MPANLPVPSLLVVMVLMGIFGAIVGAWVWAIIRLALRLPVLPTPTPRLVPWGAGSVLLTVLFWIGLQILVPSVYLASTRFRPAAAPAIGRSGLSPGEQMGLSAVVNAATLVLVPILLAASSGARPRDLGVEASGLGIQVTRGLITYPLLAPIVFGIMAASVLTWGKTPHPLENAIAQDRSPGMVATLVLAGVVFAPAAEELIFRGVLLGWLTRLVIGRKPPLDPGRSLGSGLGDVLLDNPELPPIEPIEFDSTDEAPSAVRDDLSWPSSDNPYEAPHTAIASQFEVTSAAFPTRFVPLLLANVAVSLVFAALHGAVWPTPMPIFFLSLGLGLLYQRTGGIIAPIALHMTFNGVSTLLMYLTLGAGPVPKAIPVEPAKELVMRSGSESAEEIRISRRPVDGPVAY